MSAAKGPLLGFVDRFASGLRFPQLFWLTLILFLVDLLMPDVIPFADEILLGLATLLLGSWKRNREAPDEEPPPPSGKSGRGRIIDVTPEKSDGS